jgi:hypothetical protein
VSCSTALSAVVALALRIVIARVFLFDGKSRIVGMRLPLTWREFVSSILLRIQVGALILKLNIYNLSTLDDLHEFLDFVERSRALA